MNLLEGLPAEAKAVLTLQLKPKWTKADREYLAWLTRRWTDVHWQVLEDRFTGRIGRTVSRK